MVNLQVHLPNGQRVLFTEENAHAIAETPPKTTLTTFFDLCKIYVTREDMPPTPDEKFIHNLLYANVPEYFIFEEKYKTWTPRKQGKAVINEDGEETSFVKSAAVGRVYTVHLRQAECFFVRLLLHHQKDAHLLNNLEQ